MTLSATTTSKHKWFTSNMIGRLILGVFACVCAMVFYCSFVFIFNIATELSQIAN